MAHHEFKYVAGVNLPGILVTNGPTWYCTCGEWSMGAYANPRRKTGNNRIEAERSFDDHVNAQSGTFGAEDLIWEATVHGELER